MPFGFSQALPTSDGWPDAGSDGKGHTLIVHSSVDAALLTNVPNGGVCTAGNQCASTFCVSGNCCSQASCADVDPNDCTNDACGTGTCTNVAPQIFEIRSDGYLYILNDYDSHLPDELVEKAREAAELCPTGAISIEDDEGGEAESEEKPSVA